MDCLKFSNLFWNLTQRLSRGNNDKELNADNFCYLLNLKFQIMDRSDWLGNSDTFS